MKHLNSNGKFRIGNGFVFSRLNNKFHSTNLLALKKEIISILLNKL